MDCVFNNLVTGSSEDCEIRNKKYFNYEKASPQLTSTFVPVINDVSDEAKHATVFPITLQ